MPIATLNSKPKQSESLVTCETISGTEFHASVVRLTRHQVVFEVYSPSVVLRVSEALANFRIIVQERVIYSGRALVNNVVNAANLLVCEAHLEDSWEDVESIHSVNGESKLQSDFNEFIRSSQASFKIHPE